MARQVRMFAWAFITSSALAWVGPAPLHAQASPPADAPALRALCRKVSSASRMACYNNGLVSTLRTRGIPSAMQMLDSLGAIDADVKRDGHMYAHSLGLSAFDGADNVGATFRQCTPAFQSGCYHGVIQAYFSSIASASHGTVAPEAVNSICKDYRGAADGEWLLFQCAHAIGHGLSQITSHELRKTLAGCDELDNPWEQEVCYGGAFMENEMEAMQPHHMIGRPDDHAGDDHAGMDMGGMDMAGMPGMDHSAMSSNATSVKLIDPADPLYPCSSLASKYLDACYVMQTSIILYLNHGDFRDAAATCDKVDVDHRGMCYQSLGRDASSYAVQDFRKGAAYCANGDVEYRPRCHAGFVMNVIDVKADYHDALRYCATLTAGADIGACYKAIGFEIRTLLGDDTKRAAACAEAGTPMLRDACLSGAGLRLR